ncbi:MAG: ribonuclease R [Coriobacteriales bacterium]|nr:ribonuclease R [Coriobacteriales bacterium]
MSRKRPHHGNRRRPSGSTHKKQRALVQGTLHIDRPGLAHVDTAEGSFMVARRGIREGMNGDEVQVSLVPMHGRGHEPVAYVQTVVQRATTSFVGTFGLADPLGVVAPLDGRMAHDFFVLPQDKSPLHLGVREGDVVRARILEYPTRQSAGVATIEQRLGSADELDVHVEALIASYGLATNFSEAVLREAEQVRPGVREALEGDALRRDCREKLCVTIDPADARDFDDAVAAMELDDGFRLFVHIADVSHYVAWDSSMDAEARMRTCSTYLVDRVLPMLPERLCNDVCSLRPCEDRLAMSVELRLNRRGEVVEAEAYPSAIRSRARLSYDQVDALLAGEVGARDLPCDPQDSEPIARMLRILDKVAQLRLAVRHDRGAIDFASSESKVLLDEGGRPVSVSVRERTRATSLVEEAMLMANESVAKLLADRDLPCAYRVHEQPSPDDLGGCVTPLRELGLLADLDVARLVAGDPVAIQALLERAQGTNAEFLANALLLRAQKRAIYLPHNDGHYALGAKAYCHFTSPIRRYPDVVVHRALKALLAGRLESREQHQIQAQLAQICRSCSERERVADSASRASQRIKMAELYAEHVGERYSGIVVGCERYGLFVRLDDTGAEGFVPTRSLGDEWFAYDDERMVLVGESTGRIWGLGKRVAVEVSDCDVAKGRIDFVLPTRASRQGLSRQG